MNAQLCADPRQRASLLVKVDGAVDLVVGVLAGG